MCRSKACNHKAAWMIPQASAESGRVGASRRAGCRSTRKSQAPQDAHLLAPSRAAHAGRQPSGCGFRRPWPAANAEDSGASRRIEPDALLAFDVKLLQIAGKAARDNAADERTHDAADAGG